MRKYRDRLGWLVLLVQLGTAAVIWLGWSKLRDREPGDTLYYQSSLANLSDPTLQTVMPEYPVPAVWLLQVPYLLSDGSLDGYRDAFVVLSAFTGFAFTAILWDQGVRHNNRPGGAIAAMSWCVFCAFIGPVLWLRLDLTVTVMIGCAALFAARHPVVSGVLLAFAGWVRIWPAALVSAIIPWREQRLRTLGGFVLSGAALALMVLLVTGPQRLLSPLTYQSERGLQVESIWASPLLVKRIFDPVGFPVRYTQYKSFEIYGQGREFWLSVADVASIVAIGVCLALAIATTVRNAHGNALPAAFGIATSMLVITCLVIVVNKTLSPQYIVWLGGFLAAAVFAAEGTQRATAYRWMAIGLVVAILTQLVYPYTYNDLVWGAKPDDVRIPALILLARNLALIVLTADVLIYAVRVLWHRAPVPKRALAPRRALTEPSSKLAGGGSLTAAQAPVMRHAYPEEGDSSGHRARSAEN